MRIGAAANYLTVGQIYLLDNERIERPLAPADIKPRLLGHWGTSPGLSLVYTHLNRVVVRDDLDVVYVIGPGTRRSRDPREHVARRHVQRDVPGRSPRRRRNAAAVPPVLVPRRGAESRRTGDARFDSRGW